MVLNKSIFEETEELFPKSDEEIKKTKPKVKPNKKTKDEVLNEFDIISKKIIELSKKEEAKRTRKPRQMSEETKKMMDRKLAIGREKSLQIRTEKAKLKKMEQAKKLLESQNNEVKLKTQTNKVEFKASSDENPLKSKLNEAIKIIEMQKQYINSMKNSGPKDEVKQQQPPKPFSFD